MTFSVFSAAREARDSLAVITNEETLTYGALEERALIAATWLAAHGIRSDGDGRPVALIATLELSTLEMLYALLTFGIPVLLVHPRLTTTERAHLFARAKPALVVDANWRRSAPRKIAELPEPTPNPDATLCIVPSSGTSGEPKLIVLRRRAFVASARASARNLDWQPADRWLLCLPLAHVGGFSIITRCLLARSTVVVCPDSTGEAIAETMLHQHATLASLVPTMLQRLPPAFTAPPGMRAILLGGAPPKADLVAEYRERGFPLLTSYGLSEACSQVSTQPYAGRFEAPSVERGITSSGRPLEGMLVRVHDEQIEIKGPTLFSGYYGQDAAPLVDGWYRTGDRGFIADSGELFVTGRTSDLIITGGENVDPLEVEAALLNVSGVSAACVFAVDHETFGQAVAAAIIVAAGRTLNVSELDRALRMTLAGYKRPRYLAVVESFAFNASGKLDRKLTRESALPRLSPMVTRP